MNRAPWAALLYARVLIFVAGSSPICALSLLKEAPAPQSPSIAQAVPSIDRAGDCISQAQTAKPIPAAFLAACVLGKSINVDNTRAVIGSISLPSSRTSRANGASIRMGLLDNFKEVLRGGGPFRRETNAAKYGSRPRVGIDISESMAIGLSALSVLLVSGALPMLWSAPQGLWQSFWLTRIVVLRGISFVFFVAFAVAFNQNTALLGDRGLLPASTYLGRIREQNPSFPETGMSWQMFNKFPTWLWLAPKGRMDACLRATAAAGMVLSGFVFINGGSNVFIQLALWLLYHSIVTVGQRWYSFGWESQLLETGAYMCVRHGGLPRTSNARAVGAALAELRL